MAHGFGGVTVWSLGPMYLGTLWWQKHVAEKILYLRQEGREQGSKDPGINLTQTKFS